MQTVNYKNKVLTLTQQAYISDDSKTYQAHATDRDGNEYQVKWPIILDNPADCDDESNMCDWDNNYNVIEL